jgi:hypothetical protein
MPPTGLFHDASLSYRFIAQLRKVQEENELLKQENQKGRDKANRRTASNARVSRPSGAVSTWKLQEVMQLTGSVEKSQMYAGIQVCTHTQRLRRV